MGGMVASTNLETPLQFVVDEVAENHFNRDALFLENLQWPNLLLKVLAIPTHKHPKGMLS